MTRNVSAEDRQQTDLVAPLSVEAPSRTVHAGEVSRARQGPEAPDIETASEEYARRFDGAAGAWLLRVQERVILRMLRRVRARTVLDVGGGHGQLVPGLVREGYRVTVVASDPRCEARIAPWTRAGLCRFLVGDLRDLPVPTCGFDAVISVRLLAHMRGWRPLIGELTRAARDTVIVDYPPARSANVLSPWLFAAKRRLEGNTRPYTIFRDRNITAAFGAWGFRRAQRRPQLFWPMVAHRLLRQPHLSAALELPPRLLGLTGWLGSPVVALFTRAKMR